MKRSASLALSCCLLAALVVPAAFAVNEDADAIREVIRSAYIEGLHENGSRDAIRAGFHPEFVMSVYREGAITRVGIEEWIARLPEEGKPPSREVTADIPDVHIVDDTAVARVEVFFDGEQVFTDFMGLYRFPEGWRIVNKIFQGH